MPNAPMLTAGNYAAVQGVLIRSIPSQLEGGRYPWCPSAQIHSPPYIPHTRTLVGCSPLFHTHKTRCVVLLYPSVSLCLFFPHMQVPHVISGATWPSGVH